MELVSELPGRIATSGGGNVAFLGAKCRREDKTPQLANVQLWQGSPEECTVREVHDEEILSSKTQICHVPIHISIYYSAQTLRLPSPTRNR